MPKFAPSIIALALTMPMAVHAQTACEPYTIASGDTLRLIAERVFGSRDLSPVIYNANRNLIGLNPNNITIGMELSIPCDATASRIVRVIVPQSGDASDGGNDQAGSTGLNLPTIQPPNAETAIEEVVATPEVEAPEVETITPVIVKIPAGAALEDTSDQTDTVDVADPPVEAPAVVEPETPVVVEVNEPIEAETNSAAIDLSGFPDNPIFVSAGTFPPFSDGDGNGMMTDIVMAALFGADYVSKTTTNAVSQPFDPLMASSDPDVILSYPWINPNCDESSVLSQRSATLCDNFQFSEKTYEIVMTFFVADRSGLAQASAASEFAGKRICVPEQYPTSHLLAAGFNPSQVEISRGNSVAECMGKLLSGQTDVVNADYLSVESTYAVLNSQSIIVENPSFTWIRSVHAIANQNSPAALQTLADFDNGLRRIRESGEWKEIVTPYLE